MKAFASIAGAGDKEGGRVCEEEKGGDVRDKDTRNISADDSMSDNLNKNKKKSDNNSNNNNNNNENNNNKDDINNNANAKINKISNNTNKNVSKYAMRQLHVILLKNKNVPGRFMLTAI